MYFRRNSRVVRKVLSLSLLSYLYFLLSARQWWVFVFIYWWADTLYLEKGANQAVGNILQSTKCMMGVLVNPWILGRIRWNWNIFTMVELLLIFLLVFSWTNKPKILHLSSSTKCQSLRNSFISYNLSYFIGLLLFLT